MKQTTKHGITTFEKPMTEKQALACGKKNMPKDLRRAGFSVHIYHATMDINGWVGYRINFGK